MGERRLAKKKKKIEFFFLGQRTKIVREKKKSVSVSDEIVQSLHFSFSYPKALFVTRVVSFWEIP